MIFVATAQVVDVPIHGNPAYEPLEVACQYQMQAPGKPHMYNYIMLYSEFDI